MEVASLQNLACTARRHHCNTFPLAQCSIDNPYIGDHTFVGVVMRVEDQSTERLVNVAFGGWNMFDDRFKYLLCAYTFFRGCQDTLFFGQTNHILDFLLYAF